MNPVNRLGGVVAVTVVTFLSLAGVVLGAAFIVDNTRSTDYADMETVEAMITDYEAKGDEDGWIEDYLEFELEEDIPDFEFDTYTLEKGPDFVLRIYEDGMEEMWRDGETPEFTFRGYVVPSDELDGHEQWLDEYSGTVDEIMEDLFLNEESFLFEEIGPEFEANLHELFERFFGDEFYLYEYDEKDEEDDE